VVRIGFGRDSHQFEHTKKRPLVLGGITISDSGGLAANSDGDVILHALFNAISQACGGKSLGHYADPMCKRGITDSKEYIAVAYTMAKDHGYLINNAGIMIEAKNPYLSDEQIAQMKHTIAELLAISDSSIGITFTSGEELTAFGRGEGILVEVVVTLIKSY